jgi:hypothetical protein
MKSINQILNYDRELLDNKSVQKLITYIEELEDEIIELKQSNKSSKEQHILDFLFSIKKSCNDIIKADEENIRFNLNESYDYKNAITILNHNISEFFKDNNIF